MAKRRIGAVERLFPMPCPIVVSGTMEHADGLAVAWINVIASTPPTIAMGLRCSRYTLELIRETGSFTVNIPSSDLAPEVDYFGLASGRMVDKFAVSGLTLSPGAVVEAPIVDQCPYNIECRVTEESLLGNYVVVLGEIVEAHADESVLREPGSDLVDVDALDPLCYLAGVREYRRLGEKVADAFSVGKVFMEDGE